METGLRIEHLQRVDTVRLDGDAVVEITHGIVRKGIAGRKKRVLVEDLIRLFVTVVLCLLLHTDLVFIALACQSDKRHYSGHVIQNGAHVTQLAQQISLALLNMRIMTSIYGRFISVWISFVPPIGLCTYAPLSEHEGRGIAGVPRTGMEAEH